MKNILIDTDVILDFFFDREPFVTHAAKILSLCEKRKITGWISPVILSNAYYILCQKEKQSKVIQNLKLLMNFLEVSTIDKECVLNALHSDFKDFEDALQHYSAEKNPKIQAIITRNTKDFKYSNLPVFDPSEYLKIKTSE